MKIIYSMKFAREYKYTAKLIQYLIGPVKAKNKRKKKS